MKIYNNFIQKNNVFKPNFKQEKEKPLEIISLNVKTDQFAKETNSLDIARIKGIGISNFRLINSQTIRGVTLSNQKVDILKELKESGVNTVIDLRMEGDPYSDYAKNCRANGLDYLNFKLKLNMPIFNPLHATKLSSEDRIQENEKFIKQLPDFFEKMNQGKCYIACLLGLHRTDLATTLNYLMNPVEPETPPMLSHIFLSDEKNFTNKYIGAIKNLLRNLTEKDINFLQLPNNFKEIFNSRILKLRMMNKVKF